MSTVVERAMLGMAMNSIRMGLDTIKENLEHLTDRERVDLAKTFRLIADGIEPTKEKEQS